MALGHTHTHTHTHTHVRSPAPSLALNNRIAPFPLLLSHSRSSAAGSSTPSSAPSTLSQPEAPSVLAPVLDHCFQPQPPRHDPLHRPPHCTVPGLRLCSGRAMRRGTSSCFRWALPIPPVPWPPQRSASSGRRATRPAAGLTHSMQPRPFPPLLAPPCLVSRRRHRAAIHPFTAPPRRHGADFSTTRSRHNQ